MCVFRYLECVRIPHTEPLEHEFRWGQRADVEVSKVKILEFIAEVSVCESLSETPVCLLSLVTFVMFQLHQQDPKTWSQQYREAQASCTQASTSSQR